MKILLQSVVKCHNLIFYVTGKVENFHGMNCFFLHCLPISYFIIHVCNQIIDKHSEMTKSWNFQTSPYQKLKSNFRVSHLIPIFLGLMCYTKIRKDENKLSIIDLTSYSQSDHILGENSLQSVVKMSLFFPSLPSYFLFHNICFQSKNWWTLWNDWILKFLNITISKA